MNGSAAMTSCPSEHTLDQFMAGGLDGAGRRNVVEHIAGCTSCRSVYFVDKTRRTRARAIVAGVVVVIVAAAVLAVLFGRRAVASKNEMAALIKAADRFPVRPVAGRLSGDFAYKPLGVITRSASLAMAAAARAPDDVVGLHANGVAHLLLREREEAVRKLEQAVQTATGEKRLLEAINRSEQPDVLNDLAVAYLERAPAIDDPRDNLLALECVERAWRIRNAQPFAWNRALALDRAGFRELAAEAWKEYLALDGTSEWAGEAREHLRISNVSFAATPSRDELAASIRESARRGDIARLRALADQNPERFRLAGEEVLLPEAASSLPRREEVWNAARQAAHVLAARGETLLRDSLDTLDRADAPAVAIAARAMADYRGGRDVIRTDYKKSFQLLTSAAKGLTETRNPLAVRAEIYRSTVRHYDKEKSDAIELIDSAVNAHPEIERWPLAAAQMYWIRGLVLHGTGDPGGALRSYDQASRAITKTTESGSRAGVEQVLADALRDIGNPREAWRHHLTAVAVMDGATLYDRKLNVLNGVVQESAREGYRSLPTLIHEGALHLARSAGDPLYLCSTLVVGTKLAVDRRDLPRATSLLAEAEGEWARLTDSAMAKRVRADIEVTRFRLMRAAGQQPDVAALTRALSLVTGIDNHTRLAELHLLRAGALLIRGDRDRAREDLRTGLHELDSQREKLSDEEKRTQAAVAVDLLDEWIGLELDAGNSEAAFDLAERGRARLLLERTSGAGSHRLLRWSEIRPRLRKDLVVVAYSLLRNRLVIWRGTREGLTVRHTPLDALAFREDIETFSRFVAGDTSERPSRDLHSLLCREALADAGASTVLFVPDSEMFDLPFAALRDPSTGSYLVEQHAFAIAPSVSLAVLLDERESDDGRGASLVVAVSNAPGSPVLPAVRGEVKEVAARLTNATVLMDEEVTVDTFKRHAAASNVIHFAGHGVANPHRPERSALIFGSGAERGSVLTAGQIAAMQFDSLDLVVLSACQTAEGTSIAEAPMTLATAFMTAGATTVIASTMDASDDASARLFEEFYARYRERTPVVDALRAAQLEVLRDPRYAQPRHWAPFTVIGPPAARRQY